MHFLDYLFLLVLIILLVFGLSRNERSSPAPRLPIVFLTGFAVAMPFIFGFRWQLFPGLLMLPFLTRSAIRSHKQTLPGKTVRSAFSLLALSGSIFLCSRFPIVNLPEPSGTYSVGNFQHSFTDESRAEVFDESHRRALFLDIWYPADPLQNEDYSRLKVWQELYSGDADWIYWVTSYLQAIETHSLVQAPIITGQEFPLLIFGHGLYSFTSQNILLMEELASQGYVVVSIGHTYQSLKVNFPNRPSSLFQTGWPEATDPAIGQPTPGLIEAGLTELVGTPVSSRYRVLHEVLEGFREAPDEESRRALIREVSQHAQWLGLPSDYPDDYLYNYLINEIQQAEPYIQYWVDDIDSVLNYLPQLEAPIPGFQEAIDLHKLGVFGMSFGGAAAGEFCKIDRRCLVGSNIDGFQFGKNWKTPLSVPFLLIYSDALRGNTDWAYLESGDMIEIVSIDGTTHANLTDFPRLLPILNLLGSSGNIEVDRATSVLNHLLVGFFDQHLKDKTLEADFFYRYPEIRQRSLHQ